VFQVVLTIFNAILTLVNIYITEYSMGKGYEMLRYRNTKMEGFILYNLG